MTHHHTRVAAGRPSARRADARRLPAGRGRAPRPRRRPGRRPHAGHVGRPVHARPDARRAPPTPRRGRSARPCRAARSAASSRPAPPTSPRVRWCSANAAWRDVAVLDARAAVVLPELDGHPGQLPPRRARHARADRVGGAVPGGRLPRGRRRLRLRCRGRRRQPGRPVRPAARRLARSSAAPVRRRRSAG